MCKRIIALMLLIVSSFAFSSCGVYEAYSDWKERNEKYHDLAGKIEYLRDNELEIFYVEYEGKRYNEDTSWPFKVCDDNKTWKPLKDDVLISWSQAPLGMGYLDEYYSYTADNPVYIYMPRLGQTFVREDYDYKTDTFVIEGTNIEFSDMLTYITARWYEDERPLIKAEGTTSICSKLYPQFRLPLKIFCYNNEWYAGGDYDDILFKASDELLSLLNINKSNSNQ